ncbi:ABC transporter ATP-binding protein [Bacillus salitolerans]|uniref:ABC transporter ATP-binding protein n=1 Tax=Bacillus salitolerans TaxID=1437434 RepID=A0ABW4LQ80_9BACI
MYTIQVKNISREFVVKGVVKKAVQSLSFNVKGGTIFGLLGPNGAGKSTTIKMMNTLLLPTSGELTVLDHDIYTKEKQIRSEIGFLYGGETGLYWQLSGRDNLKYFGSLFKIEPSLLEERINYWLQRLGLEKDQHVLTMRYSKGMKQRLHIARTLLHDPQILFMDEPTLGLDPEGTKDLRNIMMELKAKGKTIILTTHDMEEAEELCDEIAFIMDGKIVSIGTVQELQEKYEEGNEYHIEIGRELPVWIESELKSLNYLMKDPIFQINGTILLHVQLPNSANGEKELGELVSILAPYNIKQIVKKQMDLREIYLKIVSGYSDKEQGVELLV